MAGKGRVKQCWVAAGGCGASAEVGGDVGVEV